MADTSGQGSYAAFDHTDLERRRKKLWNLADGIPLTILGGIDLRALVIAVFVFAGLLPLGLLVPIPPLWAILACVGVAVGVYILWPHRWRSGLTTEQALLVVLDFLFLQPRKVHGLAADVEPDVVHWRVILWHPRSRKWRAALAVARSRRTLRRPHPDDALLPGAAVRDDRHPAGPATRNGWAA